MQRGNLKVMLSLVGLVKPLMGFMLLAITLGVLGHLCATFITVFGVQALLNVVNGQSVTVILLVCMFVFGILRGLLRYGEQACNHFIAFTLLAHIRNSIFEKLATLAPAKLDGKDKGNHP